jgi:hypothetical protein
MIEESTTRIDGLTRSDIQKTLTEKFGDAMDLIRQSDFEPTKENIKSLHEAILCLGSKVILGR